MGALLERFSGGDIEARDELFRIVASELHDLARREMRHQPPGHTLQATAVMNEAYLKLFGHEPRTFQDKAHLLRAATQAMKQVLMDHARAKLTLKRRDPGERVDLDSEPVAAHDEAAARFIEFGELIEKLARVRPDMARALEMKMLFGLQQEEIAAALNLPLRTYQRDFAAACALLVQWLK